MLAPRLERGNCAHAWFGGRFESGRNVALHRGLCLMLHDTEGSSHIVLPRSGVEISPLLRGNCAFV